MRPIRVLALDFDGVIVDSNAAKTRAYERLFANDPANARHMMEHHLANFTAPRRAKIEHWVFRVQGRRGDVALVDRLVADYGRLVADELPGAPLVPGARELLQEFSKRLPIYVSSVTPEPELNAIIRERGLDPFIKRAYGDPPTPKPEALRTMIRDEAVQPADLLFIGDNPSDQRAAEAVGTEFLPRDSGTVFPHPPSRPVKDLHEAASLLRARIQR